MSEIPDALTAVPKPALHHVLVAIGRRRVDCPLTKPDLQALGLGPLADPIASALRGLDRAGVLTALRVVLVEDAHRERRYVNDTAPEGFAAGPSSTSSGSSAGSSSIGPDALIP